MNYPAASPSSTPKAASPHIPIQSLRVETLDNAEHAAEQLRQQWNVGVDPIANLTAVLEDHAIHVVDLEADETFLTTQPHPQRGDIWVKMGRVSPRLMDELAAAIAAVVEYV